MKSKDRIVIQKIIGYITDIEKYVENMEAIEFLDDKKNNYCLCIYGFSNWRDFKGNHRKNTRKIYGHPMEKY